MQIDKAQILDLLRSQGDQGKADQADQQLPGTVDTEQHAGLLQQLGIDPVELVKMLTGGSGQGGGGIAGKLGGILGR
ncbi:hypothetical protein [Geodermatophilus marinus]|uniref:hypothetical protein n=1 Tax=Geodermatophilus sp. LHW52908 TaxID=2303986 RepID=UPI000E3E40DA|nr:hypothetical protein [Geodermatophilus sp. LHW52908]RFU20114.1 hypothetical protein D0Z06_17645 [Geodermatophilus sp. LHW52908]